MKVRFLSFELSNRDFETISSSSRGGKCVEIYEKQIEREVQRTRLLGVTCVERCGTIVYIIISDEKPEITIQIHTHTHRQVPLTRNRESCEQPECE